MLLIKSSELIELIEPVRLTEPVLELIIYSI